MLVSPTRNCGVGGLSQREWFCDAVEYRLMVFNGNLLPRQRAGIYIVIGGGGTWQSVVFTATAWNEEFS